MITFPRWPVKVSDTAKAVKGGYHVRLRRVFAAGSGPAAVTFSKPIPFFPTGKKCVIERAQVKRSRQGDNAVVTVEMVIDVQQNPIPLLVLIGGAAAAIGLAGWGVSESVDSVSRLLNSPILWTVVIVGGLYFLKKSGVIKGFRLK